VEALLSQHDVAARVRRPSEHVQGAAADRDLGTGNLDRALRMGLDLLGIAVSIGHAGKVDVRERRDPVIPA
jgi:hypothetical protein